MKRRVPRDPGIVHQHVNRPDFSLDRLQASANGVIVGHIELVDLDARFAGKFGRCRVVAAIIGRDHISLRF